MNIVHKILLRCLISDTLADVAEEVLSEVLGRICVTLDSLYKVIFLLTVGGNCKLKGNPIAKIIRFQFVRISRSPGSFRKTNAMSS